MKNRLEVTSWNSDARFALDAQPIQSNWRRFSSACLDTAHKLKEAVASELTNKFSATLRPEFVRQIVNEADAIAAATGFQSLFLPTLAEEKVVLASRWVAKQQMVQRRSVAFAA